MKKLVFALSLVSIVMLMGNCNSSSSNKSGDDPKATLLAFFDAMGKKDMESVRKLTTSESKGMIDMMQMGMNMAKDNSALPKYDKTNMEIGEAVINGEEATVVAKEKTSGESINFTLKKQEGAWKVAFDMGSMMQMATDKMKEKGVSADSMKMMMNEMKNLNIDSLQKVLKEGMNAMDSAK